MISLALFGKRMPGGGGIPAVHRPEPTLDLRTPIAEAEYVVFDTELTGMQARKDSIVSIGAVKMAGVKIRPGQHFNRMVHPRTELTGNSIVIHGITPSEARDCPGIESALPEFLEFCRGCVLVGHLVSLDLRFLNAELERCLGAPIRNPAVDTLTLTAYLWKREGDYCAFHEERPGPVDLYSLATAYGIPVHHAHDAAYDAYVTAQLFQRYLALLPKLGVRTVGELVKIGKP
jgi:DNA polymerase III subunit epsilon